MCDCRIFSGDEDRNELLKEIKSFEDAEVIYAATPFGLWNKIPDPQKQIVRSPEHIDFQRLTKVKTKSNMHWKYLIAKFPNGEMKLITGSGNFTHNSIFDEDDWYELVCRSCCKERFEEHFSNWQYSWTNASKPKEEIIEVKA